MYVELRQARGLGRRGRLTPQNEDLLWLPRSAVVASLSALDAYVHTVIIERVPVALQSNPIPNALCEAMANLIPIKNAGTFRDALPTLAAHNIYSELTEKLKEKTLSFVSYQAPEKIASGYELIGCANIFDLVSEIWQGPRSSSDDLRRSLAGYVKRRNQIAHEGDRELNGTVRHMQPKYANDCADFVSNLVSRLDRVVFG